MVDKNINFNEPEVTLAEDAKTFAFPTWLRWAAVVLLSISLMATVSSFVNFALNPSTAIAPSKLGIGPVFIFSFFGLIAFLIPWEEYGLRIKKFGPLEFEQILAEQASEHLEEIECLKNRIDEIEKECLESKNDEPAQEIEEKRNKQKLLEDSLYNFLEEWKKYAFSPLRIERWGTKQPGHQDLNNYSASEIRTALRAMVIQGRIKATISKKGNTLYKYNRANMLNNWAALGNQLNYGLDSSIGCKNTSSPDCIDGYYFRYIFERFCFSKISRK